VSALAALAATPLLAVIAVDDLRHHRVRNRHVLALAVLAAIALFVVGLGGDGAAAGHAALGAALATAPLAATWVAQPGRIGAGDVKLAFVPGALLGMISPALAVAMVGIGLVVSLVAALVTGRERVPLAPAMTMVFLALAVASAAT